MDSSPRAKSICRARSQQFLKLININVLGREKAMKVDCTTATPHDKGRADAAQDLENKDYRAVQRLLTLQPMLHLLTLHRILETHP
jgi:hypothetical protein